MGTLQIRRVAPHALVGPKVVLFVESKSPMSHVQMSGSGSWRPRTLEKGTPPDPQDPGPREVGTLQIRRVAPHALICHNVVLFLLPNPMAMTLRPLVRDHGTHGTLQKGTPLRP